jgi:hypothetical protein
MGASRSFLEMGLQSHKLSTKFLILIEFKTTKKQIGLKSNFQRVANLKRTAFLELGLQSHKLFPKSS